MVRRRADRQRAEVSACQCLYLLMDRYLFDLLRWTLGPESRGGRLLGAEALKLREIDNNTHPALMSEFSDPEASLTLFWHVPIVAVRLFEGIKS